MLCCNIRYRSYGEGFPGVNDRARSSFQSPTMFRPRLLETLAKPLDMPAGNVKRGVGPVRLQVARVTRRGCFRGVGRLRGPDCPERASVCGLEPPARPTDRLPAQTRIWSKLGGKSSDVGPLAEQCEAGAGRRTVLPQDSTHVEESRHRPAPTRSLRSGNAAPCLALNHERESP